MSTNSPNHTAPLLAVSPLLITRPLTPRQMGLIRASRIQTFVEPLIDFAFPNADQKLIDCFEKLQDKANVVVTSIKAARVLVDFLERYPQYRKKGAYFAVGKKNRNYLHRSGYLAYKPKVHKAADLADFLIEQHPKKGRDVVYLCGNLSLDILPKKLRKAGISVELVEVYETVLLKKDIQKIPHRAAAFMSPSAVDAYAQSGGFESSTKKLYFAVGSTTAQAFAQYNQEVITLGSEPSFENLFELIHKYHKIFTLAHI